MTNKAIRVISAQTVAKLGTYYVRAHAYRVVLSEGCSNPFLL